MFKKFLFLFILLSLFFQVSFANIKSKKITFRADSWCPYNCDPKSHDYKNYPGYIIEILNKSFGKDHVDYQLETLTPEEQKITQNSAWKQAIWDTSQGKFDAIVGAGEDDISGQSLIPTYEKFSSAMFVKSDQVGAVENCFFTTKGSSLNPLMPADLNSDNFKNIDLKSIENVKKLGIIDGYAYSVDLDNYIKTQKNNKSPNIVEADNDAALIADSIQGKNDVFVEDRNVLQYYKKHAHDVNASKIRAAGCIPNGGGALYVAFSIKKPKEAEIYVKKLNDTIRNLENSTNQTKNMQSILDKYGIKPWW